MLQFLYIIILLYCPIIIQSQDIEIEGIMRVGDSFLSQLQNNIRTKIRSDDNSGSSKEENYRSSLSRKNIESSEKFDSLNTIPKKLDDIEPAPKTPTHILTGNLVKNYNSNKVNSEEPIQKNNASYDSEIGRFLDTDTSDDDFKHGKHKQKKDAIKTKSPSKLNVIHSNSKNYQDTSNKSFRSNQNSEETEQKIGTSDTYTRGDNIKHGKHKQKKDASKTKSSLKSIVFPKTFYQDTSNNTFKSTQNSDESEQVVIRIISDTKSKSKNTAKTNEDSKGSNRNKKNSKNNYAFKNQPTNPLLKKDHPLVKKFLNHFIFDEVENIERIAYHIKEKVAINKSDMVSLLNITRTNYITKMKRYVTYVNNQETTCDIDREYLYLDIVASSNMLIYSEARQLLNTMIEKSNSNISIYDLETLTQHIYEEHVNHKKRAIFYVCQELNVCRSYPGFSDYFAELISEVLKLSDFRLGYIVKAITKLIKRRDNFFKAILKNNVADMIGEKLEVMSMDLFDFREMFAIIRSIIVQRFKMMKTSDDKLRIRTKAVRLLIDIIDKTFSLAAGIDLTAMTFDTAVQGIRHWALGHRDDVDIPLKLLLEHIVSVINVNWNQYVSREVAMLTEVIMTGKTDMTIIYDELFARGSPFVRYDLVESD